MTAAELRCFPSQHRYHQSRESEEILSFSQRKRTEFPFSGETAHVPLHSCPQGCRVAPVRVGVFWLQKQKPRTMLLVAVKHARKHLHLANFVRNTNLDIVNFYELPNIAINLKKLSNGHTGCLCSKLVCTARPVARDDLCGATFNAANWWKDISYIHQHFGHRIK